MKSLSNQTLSPAHPNLGNSTELYFCEEINFCSFIPGRRIKQRLLFLSSYACLASYVNSKGLSKFINSSIWPYLFIFIPKRPIISYNNYNLKKILIIIGESLGVNFLLVLPKINDFGPSFYFTTKWYETSLHYIYMVRQWKKINFLF